MPIKVSRCSNSSTGAGEGDFTIPTEKINSRIGIFQGIFQILRALNFIEDKWRHFHAYTAWLRS